MLVANSMTTNYYYYLNYYYWKLLYQIRQQTKKREREKRGTEWLNNWSLHNTLPNYY